MTRTPPDAWATWSPDIELTDADRLAVEKAVGRPLDDSEWGGLASALAFYADNVRIHRQRPRAKIVRGKLDRLAKAAREMARLLSEIGDADNNDNQAAASILHDEAGPNCSALRADVLRLAMAADAGRAKLPPDGQADGRDADPYIGALIAAVVAVMDDGASNPAVARTLVAALGPIENMRREVRLHKMTADAATKAVERARQK